MSEFMWINPLVNITSNGVLPKHVPVYVARNQAEAWIARGMAVECADPATQEELVDQGEGQPEPPETRTGVTGDGDAPSWDTSAEPALDLGTLDAIAEESGLKSDWLVEATVAIEEALEVDTPAGGFDQIVERSRESGLKRDLMANVEAFIKAYQLDHSGSQES